MDILVATTNPGKIAEFKKLLDIPGINWLSLKDFPSLSEVEEDGDTFEENSRKKAVGYSLQTGCWTLADDSGLEVDALDGEPGVRSARYSVLEQDDSPRDIVDEKNLQMVLDKLKGVCDEDRTARFVCVLTLADGSNVLSSHRGVIEGVIGHEKRGTNGFGYDPIFFVPSLGKTTAELTEEHKNGLSHRGNAAKKLKSVLPDIIREHSR